MQLFDDEFFAITPSMNGSHAQSGALFDPTHSSLNHSAHMVQDGSKACLFTLLAYAKDFEQLIHCQKLVRLIAKKYPCKIIFASIDPTATESYRVEKGLYKNSSNGTSSPIIGEMVTVVSSPDLISRIPFSILPEIVPDLPFYLISNDEPLKAEKALAPLMSHVTKIIFEPQQLTNYPAFAQEIISSANKSKYVDLNWIKLKPWREALFRIFDDEVKASHIAKASNISLRYSKSATRSEHESPDAQAIYLQAWLCDRLGWQLEKIEEKDEKLYFSFTHEEGPLSFDITPFDSAVIEEGGILSLEISGYKGTHYLIAYEQDDKHIMVHSSSPDRCEMPFSLFGGGYQRGNLVGNELFRRNQEDSAYLASLHTLMSPEWKNKRTLSAMHFG